MSYPHGISAIIADGETVVDGMACVFTGNGEEIRVGDVGEEDILAGFASKGGDAGDLILLTTQGYTDFIAAEELDHTNAGAGLKLAANGRLAVAGAAEAWVAQFHYRNFIGGQGGDPHLGTGDHITAGNRGRALIKRGENP